MKNKGLPWELPGQGQRVPVSKNISSVVFILDAGFMAESVLGGCITLNRLILLPTLGLTKGTASDNSLNAVLGRNFILTLQFG